MFLICDMFLFFLFGVICVLCFYRCIGQKQGALSINSSWVCTQHATWLTLSFNYALIVFCTWAASKRSASSLSTTRHTTHMHHMHPASLNEVSRVCSMLGFGIWWGDAVVAKTSTSLWRQRKRDDKVTWATKLTNSDMTGDAVAPPFFYSVSKYRRRRQYAFRSCSAVCASVITLQSWPTADLFLFSRRRTYRRQTHPGKPYYLDAFGSISPHKSVTPKNRRLQNGVGHGRANWHDPLTITII